MEALDVVAERVVEQADPDRPPGAHRLERGRGQLGREAVPDPAREQVGPVLGAVQAAHVAVVGVQHDVLARHRVVGRERERHPAGRRVAGQRRDHQVGVGLDDLADDVVDREQVPPRLGGRVLGRLDHVQVDAVGEEVAAAHQDDDAGRPRAGVAVRLEQPAALAGAHRAVVEVEVQIADARALLVGDLAPRVAVRRRRHLGVVDRRERMGGGQLEGAGRLEVRDP